MTEQGNTVADKKVVAGLSLSSLGASASAGTGEPEIMGDAIKAITYSEMRTVRVGEVLRCSGNTMAGFGDRVLKVVQLTAKQLGRSPPARKRMKARNVLPHRLPRPKLKASAACGHDHRGQVVQITRRWGMCCNVSPLKRIVKSQDIGFQGAMIWR